MKRPLQRPGRYSPALFNHRKVQQRMHQASQPSFACEVTFSTISGVNNTVLIDELATSRLRIITSDGQCLICCWSSTNNLLVQANEKRSHETL